MPGAIPLMVASLLAAVWAAGSLMEYAAVGFQTKIILFKVQAATQVPIAIAITCFILEYAWPGRWLTRRNLALLALPGLLAVVMILTDDLHHLIWNYFSFTNGTIKPQFGPGSWILLAYSFGVLGLINLLVFGWLFWHSPQHRWPVTLMLMGQLAGRMIFVLDRVHLGQSLLPLDLFGMTLEFLMYAIVLFGFRIFDPIPLARRTVIQQLHTGMLVLDTQGRIVSLNPAAQAILGKSEKYAVHHSIQELLPAYAGMFENPQVAETGQREIILGAGTDARKYEVEISPLMDWRGLGVGHLFLIHDVTEQKRTQAQILEQQRILATLTERERLARELHDSLGQVLSFASLKIGAARKWMADGRLEKADDQMAHLETTLKEAHADVREYILNLRTAPTDERPFFATLEHYLDGFRQNYGIQVDVSIGEGVDAGVFPPEAQMELFRIMQEAFSNARKHAQAECVKLSFEKDGDLVRILIQDNGRGFDASQPASEGHFGLRFMRERAEQIGGCLRVQSAAGEGTLVAVEVPVKEAKLCLTLSIYAS